jgi:hypothetical protein
MYFMPDLAGNGNQHCQNKTVSVGDFVCAACTQCNQQQLCTRHKHAGFWLATVLLPQQALPGDDTHRQL